MNFSKNTIIFIFLMIIVNHVFILFRDTSTLHNIHLISNQIWLTLLLLAYIPLSYKIMKNPASNLVETVLYGGITFGAIGTIYLILDLDQQDTAYKIILFLLTIIPVFMILINRGIVVKIYSLLFFMQSLLIAEIENIPAFQFNLIVFIDEFIEILLIVLSITFLVVNYDKLKNAMIIFSSGIVGAILSFVIISNDVALLIIRTVLNQTLGINHPSIDLELIKLTSNNILTINFFLLFALITQILVQQRGFYEGSLFATGLVIFFPIISGLRIMILLLIYRQSQLDTANIAETVY